MLITYRSVSTEAGRRCHTSHFPARLGSPSSLSLFISCSRHRWNCLNSAKHRFPFPIPLVRDCGVILPCCYFMQDKYCTRWFVILSDELLLLYMPYEAIYVMKENE